ncbi:MAG: cyanophycin synthetase, partial [Candidatus Paceibacterota bacterium]
IAQIADKQVAPVLEGLTARVIDYKPEINLSLTLTQPGLHNRMNAAAATAAAKFLGVEQSMITAALENFAGTWRRFEYKGDVNNAPVYDDYAHNPQKVAAAIAGVKEKFPNRKLTVVFQPHTYSRTKAFFDEFVTTLSGADRVVMVPIYAAREKDEGVVSSEQIVTALTKMNVSAEFFHTLEAAALSVKESVGVDDVVLVCGAGDVIMVSEALTQ